MTDRAEDNVSAHARPSELKITAMRIVSGVARAPIGPHGSRMRSTIIRLDTNQGTSGYGEVRDGGIERALMDLAGKAYGVLGFTDLNNEVLKARTDERRSALFAPTDAWNNERAHDQLWSYAAHTGRPINGYIHAPCDATRPHANPTLRVYDRA